jgi:uncharacterized protein YegP (UPF0339 family)
MIRIGQIILWEQLLDRSFSTFDVTKDDDIAALLYVIDEGDGKDKITFELYKKALSETKRSDLMLRLKDINDEIMFASQFFVKQKSGQNTGDEPEKVGDQLGDLICHGINPESIINLPLLWLSYLSNAFANHLKNRLTDKRRWAMIQVSPYLKKGTTEHDFMPFEWDENEDTEKITSDDIKIAEALFNKNKK